MRPYSFIILGIGLTWVTSACSAIETPQEDLQAPEITILEPRSDVMYTPGSELRLLVDFEENQEMHNLNVVLRSVGSGRAVTLVDQHIHVQTFTLDQSFVLPPEAGETYLLTVKASDHNDNQTGKSITFHTY